MLMSRRNRTRATALAIAALSLAASAALAQTTTQGAIGGTVFDPSGAVVSHASVTIHNDGTNAEAVVTSDGSGNFVDPLVEPGTYTVKVTASGFETYEADKVIVQVGQTTTLLPHLATGSTTTTVQVTSEAPVLNFVAPDFSQVINQTTIANVPINNRRWSALALSTPGVVPDTSGFGLVSVRGISTLLNNVEIDGADDNQAYYSEERGRTREAYSTSGSAVQEFQMNTGVYSAEYGRAAGGVINSVTKSGTNTLHGQLYFYDRESNWNAKNPYTKLTTLVNGVSSTSVVKPEDLRKIYGFTAGGALIKDKLFWMYTYDQHSRIFPAIGTPSIPSTFYALPDAATVSGGNSFVQANGNTYTCNTATGYAQPTGTTTAAASTIDAQVCTMAARLGMTYSAGASYYNTGLQALTTDLGLITRAGYQEINTPKLDWQVNQKEHLSFLFHRLRWDSPGGVQTSNPVFYALDTTGTDFVKLDYGVTKLTSLITSSISNEILYQYGRELNDEGQTPYTAYTKNNLLGSNGTTANVPQVVFASSAGTLTFGSPYYSYRPVYPDERKWQIEGTLYWAHGNHTMKFGADLLHNSDLQVNTFESNGVFNYNYISNYLTDLYAAKNNVANSCNSAAAGNSTANSGSGQVAGIPGTDIYPCYNSFVQGFGPPAFGVTTLDYGIFAQDNWKFSPRLTLEFGLRYDQEMLPTEPAAYVNAAVPQTANHPSDRNNFGPRIGFAWDPYGTGKTILRGGFGMYYGRIPNAVILNAQLNTATSQAQYLTTYKPAATSSTPQGPNLPNIKGAATNGPVSPAIEYLDAHLQDPMVEEYDLILQQQVGKGTVVSVSYLGALGKELTNFLDLNLNPATQNVTINIVDSTGKSPLPNGAQYIVPTFTSYSTGGTTFGAITDVISNINSNYNALVGEIQNHTLHSIQFDASYTWSHALDFTQNATTTTATSGENWLNPYSNARANYGNGNYNTPNHLVGYVVYNLPNFVDRRNWASYVANDWSIDDSFNAGSGLPWSIGVSGFNSTAAVLGGWNGSGVTSYIPLLGRNTQKYPRHVVDDVRLQKGIRFSERYQLDLLCNVFNVANHQNIDGVNTTGYTFTDSSTNSTLSTLTYNQSGGVPTVGTTSSSNSSGFLFTPRQLELAAKFHF